MTERLSLLVSAAVFAARLAALPSLAQTTASPTRAHVDDAGVRRLSTAARPARRRTAGRRLHRGAAGAARRQTAAGPHRHVRAVRVHRRQPRRRLDASRVGATASFNAARGTVQALSFSDDATVDGDGGVRRLRHRRSRSRRTSATTATPPSTSRTRSSSSCATSPRTPIRRRGRSSPATPTCATRRMAARQRGAKALLVVTGPRSPNAGETVPMTLRHGARRLRHSRRQRQRRVAERALRRRSEDRSPTCSRSSTRGNPHVAGFALAGVTVDADDGRRPREADRRATSSPTCRRRRRWPASTSRGSSSAPTTITSDAATTATRWPRRTRPADPSRRRRQRVGHRRGAGDRRDAVASSRARRNIAAGALVGRRDRPGRLERVRATRRRCRSIRSPRTSTSTWSAACRTTSWSSRRPAPAECGRALLERANVAAGFDLTVQADPYQPTDVATFNQAGVPSLSFTTGAHADYHKPSDTADKINYEDLDRIVGVRRRHRRVDRRSRRGAAVHQGRAADVAGGVGAPACASSPARFPTTRPRSKGCCSAASSAAGRPNRRACRRATSSSRSPARRSPTSTTTPMRWSC